MSVSLLDLSRPMLKAPPTHTEVFAEHYNQLLVVARSLVNNDIDQARDLVHDALIKFVRVAPDLRKINNIGSYLRTLVRNLFKSQRQRMSVVIPIETYNLFESVMSEVVDRYCNPHLLLQIQDVLRAICEYACSRKEELKFGSVLILRFFHGYHTSEIARVMGVSSSAVSHLLKLARAEVFVYLNDPKRLNFSHGVAHAGRVSGLNYGCLVDDLMDELRRAIFQPPSSHTCISRFTLQKLYVGPRQEQIDCKTLAHIVSCEGCLDAVNTLLGLEMLSTRYTIDTLGRRTKDQNKSEWTTTMRETPPKRAMLHSIQAAYGD